MSLVHKFNLKNTSNSYVTLYLIICNTLPHNSYNIPVSGLYISYKGGVVSIQIVWHFNLVKIPI